VIYQSDPDVAPDDAFTAGRLHHLVAGNRGRLLDARRTPITVTAVAPERGGFEVEIGAFEDAGARWELPLEEVERFQFARGSVLATQGTVARLQRAVARFDHMASIDCDPAARDETVSAIARERTAVSAWLSCHGPPALDLDRCIANRRGDPLAAKLLSEFMAERRLADLDDRFAERFVSNPRAGELVKGHAIVLAELGLSPYRGKVVRDPWLFDGAWCKRRRAAHIVSRLAFVGELWWSWGYGPVTLYRGMAVDGALPPPTPTSFASATFSEEVAQAHFQGGPHTRTAALWRQTVPVDRLFMTFVETSAMNRRFLEAEAVLIADPANRAF
jgi:hypothetical protein